MTSVVISHPLSNASGWPIADYIVGEKGFLTAHQRESYEVFMGRDLAAIIGQYPPLELDKDHRIRIEFAGFDPPTITPRTARQQRKTYHGRVYIRGHIEGDSGDPTEAEAEAEAESGDRVYVASVPLMVGSLLSEPHMTGECPLDSGGYYVIEGVETTTVSLENYALNQMIVEAKPVKPRIRKLVPSKVQMGKLLDGEMESDPYPYTTPTRRPLTSVSAVVNSADDRQRFDPRSTRVRLDPASRVLEVRFNGVAKGRWVPFTVLMRALGAASDLEIIRAVSGDLAPPEDDGAEAPMTQTQRRVADELRPSIMDAACLDQRSALGVVRSYVVVGKQTATMLAAHREWDDGADPERAHEERSEAVFVKHLLDHLLPHCYDGREGASVADEFAARRGYLAQMASAVLACARGDEPPTNKDSMIGRRVWTSGYMLGGLFRDAYFNLYQRMARRLRDLLATTKSAPQDEPNPLRRLLGLRTPTDLLRNLVDPNLITERWMRRAFRIDWLRAGKPIEGVTQALERTSHLGTLAHLRRIANYMKDEAKKLVGPHMLQHSAYGFYCPSNTPSGGEIGLRKHMALSATVSLQPSLAATRRINAEVSRLLVVGDDSRVAPALHSRVFHNGRLLGITDRPAELAASLRGLRRSLGPTDTTWRHISVHWAVDRRLVHVLSDPGRLMRPLLIVPEPGASKPPLVAFRRAVYEATATCHDLPSLLASGAVEYVDASESDGILIAPSLEALEGEWQEPPGAGTWRRYTHAEIHPALVFGAIGSMIPFVESNPAARNQFSCRQAKSAVGVTTTQFHRRVDKGVVKTLNYPQRPLVSTRAARAIGAEDLPDGLNAVVAIMSHTGYNQEDAIIVSQTAAERGFFNSLNTRTYFATETEGFRFEPGRSDETLDPVTGIVRRGQSVAEGDVLVAMSNSAGRRRDVTVRRYESGYVQHTPYVGLMDDDGASTKKNRESTVPVFSNVRVLKTKKPVVGDKFCSRHGQKGMCGLTIRDADMPFTRDGITPDIIINPHAFPSRMTAAQFLECVFGRVAAEVGCRVDGTFGDRASIRDLLRTFDGDAGRSRHEYGEVMIDPRSGRAMRAPVFIGPTFYRRLVQQVGDKMFYRTDEGAVDPVTAQPVRGRGSGGGLRLGEMERDAILAHGACTFQNESYTVRSDGLLRPRGGRDDEDGEMPPAVPSVLHVCDASGTRVAVNTAAGIRKHAAANESAFDDSVPGGRKMSDMAPIRDAEGRVEASLARARHTSSSAVNMPRASQVFLDELQCLGIGVDIRTRARGRASRAAEKRAEAVRGVGFADAAVVSAEEVAPVKTELHARARTIFATKPPARVLWVGGATREAAGLTEVLGDDVVVAATGANPVDRVLAMTAGSDAVWFDSETVGGMEAADLVMLVSHAVRWVVLPVDVTRLPLLMSSVSTRATFSGLFPVAGTTGSAGPAQRATVFLRVHPVAPDTTSPPLMCVRLVEAGDGDDAPAALAPGVLAKCPPESAEHDWYSEALGPRTELIRREVEGHLGAVELVAEASIQDEPSDGWEGHYLVRPSMFAPTDPRVLVMRRIDSDPSPPPLCPTLRTAAAPVEVAFRALRSMVNRQRTMAVFLRSEATLGGYDDATRRRRLDEVLCVQEMRDAARRISSSSFSDE